MALTFFIGGLLAVAGILIAFLALSSVDSGYGAAAGFRAEASATAGAEDGILQFERNGGNFSSSTYSIVTGTSTTALVSISQNTPSVGFDTILSATTISGHTKKIQVVISQNVSTGQVNVVSWADVQ